MIILPDSLIAEPGQLPRRAQGVRIAFLDTGTRAVELIIGGTQRSVHVSR